MSHLYKPLNISLKHKKLQFINGIVHFHDLYCQCDDPLRHTILEIFDQEPHLSFTEAEKNKIQQCLTGTETGGDGIDALGDGDLEKLFEEDVFGEKDTSG